MQGPGLYTRWAVRSRPDSAGSEGGKRADTAQASGGGGHDNGTASCSAGWGTSRGKRGDLCRPRPRRITNCLFGVEGPGFVESERNVETLKPQACPSPGTPGCSCFVRKLTSGSARAQGGQSCSLSGRAGHLMLTVSFSAHVLSSFPRYFAKPVLPICSLQVPDGEPRGPCALLFRRVLRADGVHQRLVGQCAPGHASSGLQSVF